MGSTPAFADESSSDELKHATSTLLARSHTEPLSRDERADVRAAYALFSSVSLANFTLPRSGSITRDVTYTVDPYGADWMLTFEIYARYRREEILAGFDYATLERGPGSHMTGVAWAEATRADLLFVMLHKTEVHFSPNTMYRDFALSADQFAGCRRTRLPPTGRRYREHAERGSHVVLFVRDVQEDDFGTGAPYTCLGQVDYVEHTGERPMAITWRLRCPMPADLYVRASAIAR
ncbi:DUF3427 domain-containing protein [Mumia qirimensis]|uniref:DUF3427 domain-containing protein n=1 Tax=Mumia qirimensis TaxID=3234852 RepID=UPI00351D595E